MNTKKILIISAILQIIASFYLIFSADRIIAQNVSTETWEEIMKSADENSDFKEFENKILDFAIKNEAKIRIVAKIVFCTTAIIYIVFNCITIKVVRENRYFEKSKMLKVFSGLTFLTSKNIMTTVMPIVSFMVLTKMKKQSRDELSIK